MTEPSSPPRTFDRAEVESILLEAARLDEARGAEHRSVALARTGDDGLTLGEIERAAAEVGISRGAVSAASLRIALRAAHAGAPRAHVVHEIAGALSAEALETVADEVRTRVPTSRVQVTPDGIEVALGKADGEPGSLLVKIRSRAGHTTVSMWSAAPVWSRGDLGTVAALGAPVFVFPAVAISGGVWPALGSVLALAAGGVVAGSGLAVAASRWRVTRWQERITGAVMAIASSVEAHTRSDT
jgi:hypothetical protein